MRVSDFFEKFLGTYSILANSKTSQELGISSFTPLLMACYMNAMDLGDGMTDCECHRPGSRVAQCTASSDLCAAKTIPVDPEKILLDTAGFQQPEGVRDVLGRLKSPTWQPSAIFEHESIWTYLPTHNAPREDFCKLRIA